MNYPSVTEIIGFVNSRAFDGVPEFMLQRAADRGTDVHTAASLLLQGLFFESPPEIAGYIKSLEDWVSNFVEEVIFVEKSLISVKYGFQGHPDALVKLRGDSGLTMIDWKTPKPLSKGWRLQLAGYKILGEENYESGLYISRVASLRLDPNGGPAKFDGYSRTLAADKNVFLSALNVWRFFRS
jgi:hypothetical protein